jgi:DNA-binding CsgD family transcriptional regulator
MKRKRSRTTGTSLAAGANAIKSISQNDLLYRTIAVEPAIAAELHDLHTLAPDPNELELRELRAQLAERLVQIAEDAGTDRQRTILRLWLSGKYTQVQIGELCGVCQTTIYKTLNGNDTYYPDGRIMRYGGLLKKIGKSAKEDPECLSLLARIAELA